MRLFILSLCLVLATADNSNNVYGKDFKFDQIEFPTELRESAFHVRHEQGQKRPYEEAIQALFAIANRLKSLLDYDADANNFLVSPLSIAVALGQLLLGAKGESRRILSEMLSPGMKSGAGAAISDLQYHQQFKNLLYLLDTGSSTNGTNAFENYELHVASAFFIQSNLRLRSDYRHAVNDFYGSDIVPLNFSINPVAVQETINNWVKVNTRGHIKSLLSNPLPPSTASLVANTVYFKGAWEIPFDPELTISGTFKINSRERVAVKYMRGQFEMLYAENQRLGCQMVILPYKHKQASMYITVPFEKDYDIRKFAASIDIDEAVELKSSAIQRSVTLIMPKMTLTSKFSLKEPLARFRKQQKTSQQAMTPRRPARPVAVRSRQKRDNNAPTLRKQFGNTKRYERGIKQESNSSPTRSQEERYNIDKRESKFEAKEQIGNIVTSSKNASHSKSAPPSLDSDTTHSQNDAIEAEIITSSIMVPVKPLMIMEVDKTYTVGLNNSHPPMNANDTNLATENFPPRLGEFDPDFQISSPLLPNFRPSSYSTQRTNMQRPRPIQPFNAAQVSGHNAYGNHDRIHFPAEDELNERQHSKPVRTPVQIPYYPVAHQGNRGGLTQLQQPDRLDSRFGSPEENVPLPARGGVIGVASQGVSNRRPGVEGDDEEIQFDLTGASEDSRFRIDDILHQVWLEVTEIGTEGAAASSGAVDYSGDIKLVLVDRPFLVAVVHEVTGATLFWGTIEDPTGGTGLRTEDALGRPPSSQSSVIHTRGR